MKKIMIIAHYYHPFSLVGAKRVNYFVKYLNNHGINTIILKADDKYYGEHVTNEKNIPVETVSVTPNESLLKISSNLAWKNAYKKVAEKILKEEQIDGIFITGGPFHYFNLGSYFNKRYDVPYILDFRDPWYRSDVDNFSIKGRISNKIESFLEHRSVSRASLIINVTESLTEEYRNRYANISQDKFVTIYNGYDDSINLDPNDKNIDDSKDTLNLGIFGKFAYYNGGHLDLLLETIKKVQPYLNKDINIYYLGTEKEILSKAKEYSLSDNIRYIGYVDYSEGMKILAQMDALLLNNRAKENLGTKVFDYIYLNKPILAFSSTDSEIGKLMNNFQNGFVVSTEEELKEALISIDSLQDKFLDTEEQKAYYSRNIQSDILLRYIFKI